MGGREEDKRERKRKIEGRKKREGTRKRVRRRVQRGDPENGKWE